MTAEIQRIVRELEQARQAGDYRTIAEDAYALAFLMMDQGDYEGARRCAQESLAAAERLPSATLDDVATTRTNVGGVPLPDYFHDGVVRAHLGGLLAD